ncbi:hypothetical protein BDV95DRAFT_596689 [Massariosphaeria phaeospora]|uniref:ABM domain-containing protein n=1 Tax=Massariosphaeria phaeospora TaxID=100035 RepID=A0A7C8M5A9_9PLEO|nr:hypothetical protein BDV95DRAFT_596689 [Massariosphaeria phaeospora]
MSQVTEIASIPLLPGLDLTTGDTHSTWTEFLGMVAGQPGCKSVYWGRQVEHPDIVQLAITWETLQHHKDFIASPQYKPFGNLLAPIAGGAPTFYHLNLPASQPFDTPGSAPVTECFAGYFDLEHSTDAFDANWAKFAEEGVKVATEALGLTGGWAEEEQKHEKCGAKEGEEGPARLFGAFIGWPNIEAHKEFSKSEAFPGLVKYLRDGPKATAVHHVAFQKF